MKIGGQPDRLELKPETEEERDAAQRIINGGAIIYWGDSEFKGGALILNSSTEPNDPARHHTDMADSAD